MPSPGYIKEQSPIQALLVDNHQSEIRALPVMMNVFDDLQLAGVAMSKYPHNGDIL